MPYIKHASNGNDAAGIFTFSMHFSYLNDSCMNHPLKKERKKTENAFSLN